MEAGFALQEATIGILGLGLMGGSLALALQAHCARLIGFDSDPSTLELARAGHIVNQAESLTQGKGLGVRVDVLLLATPVPTILQLLRQLPALVEGACIVMDIGSTKREILQAMSALPERFDPIGGHPICGREKLGLQNADANLYHNAPFVVTALDRTTHRARSAARQIISAVSATPIEMGAEEHDSILASTSHLPFLISSALAHATTPEFSSLIGTGFRSTSRLAGTPAHMMMGVLQSNRDNILHALQQFRRSLNEFESALQNENYTELDSLLMQSRTSYLSLTHNQ